MKQVMMIALLAAFAAPVLADDLNPTDTRAEFAARAANHGKYNPAMHSKKAMHKKAVAHKASAHKVVKKAAKKAK